MKIVALGGCGGVGTAAVRTLAASDVGEVVVADRELARAEALAESLGPRVQAREVDVTDSDALRALLKGSELVVNTTGPYYRLALPILRAAIEAGCDYVDADDDWEPTLEALALDDAARRAGVTAVVGMGASPGLANLLAVLAMRELDRVDELVTGWNLAAAVPPRSDRPPRAPLPNAATVHGLHQASGTIRVWRGGKYVDEPPLRRIRIAYPGLAPAHGWTFGHPEAVTLPRVRPELRLCLNVMTSSHTDALALRWAARAVGRGWISIDRAARWLDRIEARLPGEHEPLAGSSGKRLPAGLPPLFALARGTRDGQPACVGAHPLAAPRGGVNTATGIPLALAAKSLLEGRVERRGVLTPEEAFDPLAIFEALAPLCEPPRHKAEEVVEVVRSWE